MEKDRCPRCSASTITRGSVANLDGLQTGPWLFVPAWRRHAWLRWHKGVRLPASSYYFSACLSCGLVWSELSNGELRAFTERYGSADAKASLAPFSKPKVDADLA